MYTQHNIYKRNDEKNTENSSSKGTLLTLIHTQLTPTQYFLSKGGKVWVVRVREIHLIKLYQARYDLEISLSSEHAKRH